MFMFIAVEVHRKIGRFQQLFSLGSYRANKLSLIMFQNINWSELFPTKLSAIIFVSYMVLFINQGIFVTASQSSNSAYSYNTVIVVLLTEVVKLLISVALYCKDHSTSSLIKEMHLNVRIMALYFVPAFLYCLYNNLAFVNLSAFDPTTYYLLLQFRVVVTGVVFQIIFKKKLSSKQWLSLIILTAGCMIKQIDFTDTDSAKISATLATPGSENGFHLSINLVFIFIQTLCSCFAGVYNEYLLKGDGAGVNMYVQNIFMYMDSILCNAGILFCQGNLKDAYTRDSLASIFQFKVIIIMFNNAAIGIITSFFLKNLNSILKTFASALELMFTALLCWVLFGIPIYINTFLAISIVSYAVLLYSQNPVVNEGKHIPEREKYVSEKGTEEV